MRTITKLSFPIIMMIAIVLLSSSCTKTIENWIDQKEETVYDTVSVRPDNRVIEYRVENFSELNVRGAIDNEKNEIVVYVPYFSQLELLQVGIDLPEGASISPEPDELVPVFSDKPFTYTVTGESGETREYTVKIFIQQPDLLLEELSSEEETRIIPLTQTHNLIDIEGENMVPSWEATTLHLMDKEGNEVYHVNEYLGSAPFSYEITFVIPLTDKDKLETETDYWPEIRSYSLIRRMQYPIRIRK